MAERMIKRTGKQPMLLVECENLSTLMAVAKVVNESGLNAKVLMEYEVKKYGEDKNSSKDVQDGGDKD